MEKKTTKQTLIKIAIQIFLFLLAVVVLIPFVYIVLMAFGKNVISVSSNIPREFSLTNFSNLFKETKFLRWMEFLSSSPVYNGLVNCFSFSQCLCFSETNCW